MHLNQVLVRLLPEKVCNILYSPGKTLRRGEFKSPFISYMCFSGIPEHQKYDVLFLCNNVLHKQPIYFKTMAEIIVQYPQEILSQ